jgi:hypothetical protein
MNLSPDARTETEIAPSYSSHQNIKEFELLQMNSFEVIQILSNVV